MKSFCITKPTHWIQQQQNSNYNNAYRVSHLHFLIKFATKWALSEDNSPDIKFYQWLLTRVCLNTSNETFIFTKVSLKSWYLKNKPMAITHIEIIIEQIGGRINGFINSSCFFTDFSRIYDGCWRQNVPTICDRLNNFCHQNPRSTS